MISETNRALDRELQIHRRLARPGVFLDVGAHVGDFIFGLADIPGLEFVAFEPLPFALDTLRRRVTEASLPVRVVGAALSGRSGVARLDVPLLGSAPVWQWASMAKDFGELRLKNPEITGVISFDVPVETLDSFGFNNVTAIKLDAEGAEYEVLSGGRTLLATQRPILTVELEERHKIGCTYSVPAFLDALGYEGFFELDGQMLPMSRFDRTLMQRGSASPASHDYSDPYVSWFLFSPVL